MNLRRLMLALTLMSAMGVASAETRITLVERALTDATLDLGAKGDSVGDVLTFANPIYESKNRTQIGTDQGYCLRVRPGKSWECTWTITLKEGQLSIEGPFNDAGDSELAVIGGTGQFRGARGSLSLHPRDAKGSAYDFVCVLD